MYSSSYLSRCIPLRNSRLELGGREVQLSAALTEEGVACRKSISVRVP